MASRKKTTLWDLKPNASGFILKITDEITHEINSQVDFILSNKLSRLRAYGFFENQKVKLIYKLPFWGPKIFQVGDCCISINRSLAKKILIQPRLEAV